MAGVKDRINVLVRTRQLCNVQVFTEGYNLAGRGIQLSQLSVVVVNPNSYTHSLFNTSKTCQPSNGNHTNNKNRKLSSFSAACVRPRDASVARV